MFSKGPGQMRALIEDNVFTGNSAAYGGAIYISIYTSPVIRSNTFVGNSADGGGAIRSMPTTGQEFQITKNLFQDNHANDEGGVMQLDSSGASVSVTGNRLRRQRVRQGRRRSVPQGRHLGQVHHLGQRRER